MKNTGIRALAQQLQSQGRGRDTILAHIMPEEAAMLKRMGGRGSVNPVTGLLEFEAWSAAGAADAYGGSWSSGTTTRDSSSSNQSPSYTSTGGGRDSSSSNQSPSYTSTGGGGGFNTANWGTGGGMLTTGTPTMVSSGGGGWTPTSSNTSNFMQSLGVPTIVTNAAQTVGQSLLNFSDAATAQYQQMMANPSQYFGSMVPSISTTPAAEAPTVDPLTGRDYGREAVQRSIAWGEALGSGIASLRDSLSAPQEVAPSTPGFRSEAASGGYDFTPDYTGTTREAEALRNQILSQQVGDMFGTTPARQGDWGPSPEGFDVSAENVTRQIMTPTGIAIQPTSSVSVVDAAQERSIMDQIMSAPSPRLSTPSLPGFRSEAALEAAAAPAAGMSLEGLPLGRFGTFDMQTAIQQYRQALNNITVPTKVFGATFNVNPAKYANDPAYFTPDNPATNYYQTDAQVAASIMKNLPLAGLKAAEDGSIVTTEGGMPSGEQMAKVAELAAKQYTVPQSKMPEGSTGQMTLDPRQFVDVRSVPMPPERQVEVAGPPGFRSEVAQNIAQSLDMEFENLTKSSNLAEVSQPASGLRSEVLTPQYDYTPAAQSTVNIPTFAQVPVGSPMAPPETGAPAPTYATQPAAPSDIIDYSTERMTDPRMQPATLRDAIENASLYYGMGYPSLVNMQVTPAGAAGMLANIQRESSFDPAAYNPAEFGFGFAQYQRSRLEPFLNAMGINVDSLPADKAARAAAIKSALANTDTQQIGYMLNEIATTKYYAPTYRQLTQGTNPGQAATTYMRNFEGAAMVPERVAAQAANAARIARTQFAGTQLSPTVTRSIQTSGLTSPTTTQAAIQNGELGAVLDEGWKEVIAAIGEADLSAENAVPVSQDLFGETPSYTSGSGGGDRGGAPSYGGTSGAGFAQPETPVAEQPAPVYTTGMDLRRRTYVPLLPTETLSPAYS